ncbi:effector binding domain-containing protein, partial [Pseudomonas sp. HMWF021]
YLVFEAQGPLPDAVISTWGRIWEFFEQNPQIQRRYATDYEAYTGPESVAVYIGVR